MPMFLFTLLAMLRALSVSWSARALGADSSEVAEAVAQSLGVDTNNLDLDKVQMFSDSIDFEFEMQKVSIQARNGRWLEATTTDGETFVARLADGRRKTYIASELKDITYEGVSFTVSLPSMMDMEDLLASTSKVEARVEPNRKGDAMSSVHVMLLSEQRTYKVFDKTGNSMEKKIFVEETVITNVFSSPEEEKAYNTSMRTNRMIKVAGSNKYAFGVKTGAYHHRLLVERLASKGINFTLKSIPNAALAVMVDHFGDEVTDLEDGATFQWSHADATFFLATDQEGWGIGVLGLDAKLGKKFSKRANEIGRITKFSWYGENASSVFNFGKVGDTLSTSQWNILEFSTPAGRDDAEYDGMNACTPAFAAMLIRDALGMSPEEKRRTIKDVNRGILRRFNVRFITNRGLIKGDMLISQTPAGGGDFVYHTENLKDEISVDGDWFIVTMEAHNPLHAPTHEVQRMANFPSLFSFEHAKRDLEGMIADAREAVATGNIPDWMTYRQPNRDDLQTKAIEDDNLSNMLKVQRDFNPVLEGLGYSTVNSAVMFQNITGMMVNGLLARMERHLVKTSVGVMYKKMYIPMSNGLSAGVVSYAALTELCGIRVNHDGSRHFFLPEIGMVVSNDRFVETYALHGGWDLDDTATYKLMRVWSSDPIKLMNLMVQGIITPNEIIPGKEENARYALVTVRTPNGEGEYSIEFFDGDLPFFGLDLDTVETIDLANAPSGVANLVALGSGMLQLGAAPANTSAHGGEITRQDAHDMMVAQMSNPGVGPLANKLMLLATTLKSKVNGLPTAMEDFVDISMQESDLARFQWVDDLNEEIAGLMMDMSENGAKFDRAMLYTRAGQDLQDKLGKFTYNGPISALNVLYGQAIDTLRKDVLMVSLQRRAQHPFIARLRNRGLSDISKAWAEGFYAGLKLEFKHVDDMTKPDSSDNRLRKFAKTEMKAKMTSEIIAKAVEALEAFDMDPKSVRTTDQALMALWIHILSDFWSTRQNKMIAGDYDRILLAKNRNGKSISDLLVDAVHNFYPPQV